MIESVSYEIKRQLAIYLKDNAPSLNSVIEDFPEANEQLVYPCASIKTGAPKLTIEPPYEYSRDGSVVDNKQSVIWVTGQYEWDMQLDLWCGSKIERDRLVDEVNNVFMSQFPVMGLSLSMSKYYGVISRYDVIGHEFPDGEEASQRREFRAILRVLAHCKRVVERNEFIITAGEIGFQTGPTHGEHPNGYDLPVETSEVN